MSERFETSRIEDTLGLLRQIRGHYSSSPESGITGLNDARTICNNANELMYALLSGQRILDRRESFDQTYSNMIERYGNSGIASSYVRPVPSLIRTLSTLSFFLYEWNNWKGIWADYLYAQNNIDIPLDQVISADTTILSPLSTDYLISSCFAHITSKRYSVNINVLPVLVSDRPYVNVRFPQEMDQFSTKVVVVDSLGTGETTRRIQEELDKL